MDVFPFTQLLPELQDIIYNKLHVRDRINLISALPKKHVIKVKYPYDEKKLGVLAKAIHLGKVEKLSEPMKFFLRNCSSSDPTIHEICQAFPELKTYYSTITPYRSIHEKVMDGDVTMDDLQCAPDLNTHDEVSNRFAKTIYKSPLVSFRIIMNYTPIMTWMKENSFDVYFNLYNFNNVNVLRYIHDEGHYLLEWNIEALKEQIKGMSALFYITSSRKLLFEFLSITRDEYKKLWKVLLDNLLVDGVLEVEQKMKELGYEL